GYKGHVAIDPDSEIVTATGVTPGNSGDAEAAEDLLADVLPGTGTGEGTQAGTPPAPAVYGDAAYGAGELLERVENAGLHSGIKVQPPPAVKGHFPKDRFAIDLGAKTVTCPAGITVPIRARTGGHHAGEARF